MNERAWRVNGGRQFNIRKIITEEEIHEHILMWRMRDNTIAIRKLGISRPIFRFTKELFCNSKIII